MAYIVEKWPTTGTGPPSVLFINFTGCLRQGTWWVYGGSDSFDICTHYHPRHKARREAVPPQISLALRKHTSHRQTC